MTIISSGELALQDAGTNPSETVDNKLLDTTMTTGLDALLTIRQRNEGPGDGQFTNNLMWQGELYGFNSTASNFSSSFIHERWPMNTTLGIQGEKRGYSSQSAFGSLGSTTYSDNSSVNRTIRFLLWGLPDAAPSPNNNTRIFGFALAGSSVTNTDNTFEKIKITTNSGTVVTIDRDDLAYDSYENGNSWWEWHGTSGTVYNAITSLGTPSSSTSYDVEIISGTTTATSNNGIAEEIGGADSSNVALSDYYRTPGGTLHDTPGIPTSGEIKFSDFFGKTKANIVTLIHSQALAHTYLSSQYFTSSTHAASSNFTFQGYTTRLSSLANFSGTSISLTFQAQSGSPIYTNSGWTTIKVWRGQSNNSGSPDVTLYKSNMSFSVANNGTSTASATWSQNGSFSFATYFGTSNTTNFVEIE